MDRESNRAKAYGNLPGIKVLLAACIFVLAPAAYGQGDPAKLMQGVNVYADYGIPIHKSGLLAATDFSGASRLGVGTFVGKDKSIGLGLRRDAAITAFTQTNARMTTEWVDMTVGYRYWIFYPMLIVGSGNLAAKRAEVSLIDALCVERGAGLGLRMAVGKVLLSSDIAYMFVQKTRDAVNAATKIASRADFDVGAMLPLPFEAVGIYAAYRFRSYRAVIAGAGKTELETGPSVGVNIGLSP